MVGIAAFAAIAFIRRRLSGHATLELIRATLSQRRRRCQLPFEEPLHGLAEWARHARTEPSEAAELWYRGTVGAIARVYGPGGASVRPRRRVATRVSIVSGCGIEKKGRSKVGIHNIFSGVGVLPLAQSAAGAGIGRRSRSSHQVPRRARRWQ